MTLYECPRCGEEVMTNSTTAGAFEVPPTMYHPHGNKAVTMDVVTEAEVNPEAIVE